MSKSTAYVRYFVSNRREAYYYDVLVLVQNSTPFIIKAKLLLALNSKFKTYVDKDTGACAYPERGLRMHSINIQQLKIDVKNYGL